MKFLKTTYLLVLLLALTACRDIATDGQAVVRNGNTTYRGGIKDGKYDGYGQLSIGDSIVYAGEWRMGKRCGKGVSHDSLHHRIVGICAAAKNPL